MTAPALTISPRMAALPRCPVRHALIPYSTGTDPVTGAALFGTNDPDRKLACALGELCGVCGEPFDGAPMVFLAVDHGADPARLLFTDPPCHEDCAATSMRICPAIALPRHPGWVWLTASSYELAPAPPGRARAVRFTFRPAPRDQVRRFTYGAGGALTETEATC